MAGSYKNIYETLTGRFSNYGVLILLAAFLMVAAGVVLLRSPSEPAGQTRGGAVAGNATMPRGSSDGMVPSHDVSVPSNDSVVPSADNVNHALRAKEQTLKDRLAADPDDAEAHIGLARFYHDAHQPRQAADHYIVYLKDQPNDRQAWLDLTDCFAALGQWDDAQSVTAQMLEHFPQDPAALYNMGAILANSGNKEGARQWWQRASDQDVDPALSKKAAASLKRL